MTFMKPLSRDQLNDQAKGLGVTITPVQLRIGAEIEGVDFRTAITPELRDLLYAALVRHGVIFFRDQPITREQHVALARAFGELEVHPLFEGEYREVLPVRASPAENQEHFGGKELGANTWHTDMSGRRTPPKAALLRGIKIPPLGGDTMWACARSAYRGLDQATREQIETLEAEHDMLHALGRYLKSDEDRAKIAKLHPPTRHPIVRVHPDTGERMLYVNGSFTTRIPDLPPEESRALLQKLFRQFRRPEYQVRFAWTPDAVAFWDERSTQHYAVQGFEGAEERYLERVTIAGDVPFGVAAQAD